MIETNNYTENIKKIIENGIVYERTRQIQINNSRLNTYWNIGREIVKAQKEDKIKYGNSNVKELSKELTRLYGKGYDYPNLRRMRQFYNTFPKCVSLKHNFITWSHLYAILPIKVISNKKKKQIL